MKIPNTLMIFNLNEGIQIFGGKKFQTSYAAE